YSLNRAIAHLQKIQEREKEAAEKPGPSTQSEKPAIPEKEESVRRSCYQPRRPSGRVTILWVDDNPENNTDRIKYFEAVGLRVLIATSTQEAKEIIGKYAALLPKGEEEQAHGDEQQGRLHRIISDMKRNEAAPGSDQKVANPRAGIEL